MLFCCAGFGALLLLDRGGRGRLASCLGGGRGSVWSGGGNGDGGHVAISGGEGLPDDRNDL